MEKNEYCTFKKFLTKQGNSIMTITNKLPLVYGDSFPAKHDDVREAKFI